VDLRRLTECVYFRKWNSKDLCKIKHRGQEEGLIAVMWSALFRKRGKTDRRKVQIWDN
jgi:hypothetical protein